MAAVDLMFKISDAGISSPEFVASFFKTSKCLEKIPIIVTEMDPEKNAKKQVE